LQLGLRQQLLDRMIYLIQLGFVIQVVSYIEKQARRLDEKLLIYFVKKVNLFLSFPLCEKITYERREESEISVYNVVAKIENFI